MSRSNDYFGDDSSKQQDDDVVEQMKEHYGFTDDAFNQKARDVIDQFGQNPDSNNASIPCKDKDEARNLSSWIATFCYLRGLPLIPEIDDKTNSISLTVSLPLPAPTEELFTAINHPLRDIYADQLRQREKISLSSIPENSKSETSKTKESAKSASRSKRKQNALFSSTESVSNPANNEESKNTKNRSVRQKISPQNQPKTPGAKRSG